MFFSLLNSEVCNISPALSSFEIHREIIFIKLKKTILHMITLLSHVGKHRSSLYQASALGPPHKCFTCHMYFVNIWFLNAWFQKSTLFYTTSLSHTQQITQYKVHFCNGFLFTSVLRTCHTHFCEPLIFTHIWMHVCDLKEKTPMSNIPLFKD